MQTQEQNDKSEDRPLTRQEVLRYRDALAVSLRAAHRKHDRMIALSKRPSHAKKPITKAARHIRRQSAIHKQITESQTLLEQIDLELSK